MTNPIVSRTKNSRQKLLAIAAAAVILVAVVFTVVIEPQIKKRKLALAHMHQLRLRLTKMKGDLLIKDRIDNIYLQIEPLIAGKGSEQQEISLFTRELSDLYSKLNVKIRSVKILPIVDEEFYRRMSIKIELSGHIRKVLNFILSVETHPNPIRIEQLDLRARDVADDVQASFLISKVVAKPQVQD